MAEGCACLRAVVDGNANLIRGSGAVGAQRGPTGPGSYWVEFDRDVSEWAWLATAGEQTLVRDVVKSAVEGRDTFAVGERGGRM